MKVKSKEMGQVETQRELDLFRQPEKNTAPVEMIRKQQGSGTAFTLACTSSGLADQTIYKFVGVDGGTFSKIKSGLATLQDDDWPKFCHAVNNYIYPEWHAYQIGCTLVQIKSEAERRLEVAEQALAAERVKVRVLTEAINGRVAA